MLGSVLITWLLLFVGRVAGEVVCEQFATYYTWCEDGFSCCYDNLYCCENDKQIHVIHEQASWNAGTIAAVTISSVVALVVFIALGVFIYKRCTKKKREVEPPRVIYVNQAGQVVPGPHIIGDGSAAGNREQNAPSMPPPAYSAYGNNAGGENANQYYRDFRNPTKVPGGMPPQYTES